MAHKFGSLFRKHEPFEFYVTIVPARFGSVFSCEMIGALLANLTEMRIVRHEDRWSVVSPALGCEGSCLRTLAVRFGYRVGELCAELQCSERYLRTVFVRDIGLPPKEWMRQERMGVARRLLEEGMEPQGVALELGFSSLNSFRREFQQVHGTGLREWGRNVEDRTSNV